jgi:NADPH:quinone reductase-like Zn-dependent oxidoreductase
MAQLAVAGVALPQDSQVRAARSFNLVYLWDRRYLLAPVFDELMAMAESGAIAPEIGTTVPFREAARAHRLLQSRKTTGKVILVLE